MPSKRKRATAGDEGLPSGHTLKRPKPDDYSLWGWVGTEVQDASHISHEHRLTACGLAPNQFPRCPNQYTSLATNDNTMNDETIVVADEDCDKKTCKHNPWCLNYLGQEKWDNAETAAKAFRKGRSAEHDPSFDTREDDLPVGLENLGATCYANALLQVWFRHIAFRNAVYQCRPLIESSQTFSDSPVYQLQVTFAALQYLKKKAYNPIKLVESLKLRASEQQDAQEFSKLFLSHLDGEFKKQDNPMLQALITSQFEGKQAYVTFCHGCQQRSERETEFLELEVNLEPDASLEDRLLSLIADETLSGDNKYLCSNCNTLQDATRRVELRQLPPILHISLLRFVFDLASLERKKSKLALSFPETINMSQFTSDPAQSTCQDIYQLRGVLLHKGASAYHGHYEAEAFDEQAAKWYTFNDQTVTELNPSNSQAKKVKERPTVAANGDTKKAATPARINGATLGTPRRASKDAYMLVYVRLQESSATSTLFPAPTVPRHALEEVEQLNIAHEQHIQTHQSKEADALSLFGIRRDRVLAICRSWSVVSDEPIRIVSRQALESWLTQVINSDGLEARNEDTKTEELLPSTSSPVSHCLPLRDIICAHEGLDPRKSASMKCIRNDALERILADTGFRFEPSPPSIQEICAQCVNAEFADRLYKQRHPADVTRFDTVVDINPSDSDIGYWISKPWVKDWRMTKPKMHIAGVTDPAPDSAEFKSDVVCAHNGLSTLSTRRRRISTSARDVLLELFPNWTTLAVNAEPCGVCEVAASATSEDRRNMRRQAEIEKSELKAAFDSTLSETALLDLEDICALIPGPFYRSWRKWILRPADSDRPLRVDTGQFLCEHEKLNFNPSEDSDWSDVQRLIKPSEWEALGRHYEAGPSIFISSAINADTGRKEHVSSIPVCYACRKLRKTEYETTQVTVRVMNGAKTSLQKDMKQSTLLTYGKAGQRQSKRLRDVRAHGERHKVIIWPSMTVKELKLEIQKELDVNPIAQKLCHQGQPLEDNSATMSSLDIFVNDVFELYIQEEDFDLLDVDASEELSSVKRRRSEGPAFEGTLLGLPPASSQGPPSSQLTEIFSGKLCPACTFVNLDEDAELCSVCESPLQCPTG